MKIRRSFTLIELLIVVAIIGILAAIAVPNFINAQIRAKLAACKGEMKTMQTALEMYRVDHNEYMPRNTYIGNSTYATWYVYRYLISPVAYILQCPNDPFNPNAIAYAMTDSRSLPAGLNSTTMVTPEIDYFAYSMQGRLLSVPPCASPKMWLLISIGPDKFGQLDPEIFGPVTADAHLNMLYAVSNGLVSKGDIIHTSWSGMPF